MITTEIKEKIFSQYWGQIYQYHDSKSAPQFRINERTFPLDDEPVFIILKPLSAITDEDAVEIAMLGGLAGKLAAKEYVVSAGKSLVLHYFNKQTNVYGKDWFRIFQFLQSKGYALPYMDYSVEDLVKAGIYKLEE